MKNTWLWILGGIGVGGLAVYLWQRANAPQPVAYTSGGLLNSTFQVPGGGVLDFHVSPAGFPASGQLNGYGDPDGIFDAP